MNHFAKLALWPLSVALLGNISVYGQVTGLTANKSKAQVPSLFSTTTTVSPEKCYSTQMELKLQSKYPNRDNQETFEAKMESLISAKKSFRTAADDEVYRIPTIVHVIHNGEAVGTGSNISDAQVLSQFDVLNDDYRRLGAGYNDNEVGADSYIEFYPVTTDPDGNLLSTAGIDRVQGSRSSWGSTAIESILKPNTIWDSERYFNIWVVTFGNDLEDVLGYAQFPSLSGLDGLDDDEGEAETDGVVIGYAYFGNTGNVTYPYDEGRTATHEVGHWLGLRHIWGDGDCTVDDYCDDTPLAGDANYTCETVDSCPGDGLNDMIENYMDYTPDACMNIFTQDQKERMRIVMQVSPRRYSLLELCSDAVSLEAGDQTTAPGWFSYTATADQIVMVSSVGSTEVNTYLEFYNDCDSDPVNTSDDALSTTQSQLSKYLETGAELLIQWQNVYSDDDFSWSLTTAAAEDGGACELAVAVDAGDISLPATSLSSYWYSFTMTDDLSKITISGGDHTYRVYAGDCDALDLLGEATGSVYFADIDAGETVYIEFEAGGGGFDWSLEVSALEAGEACVMASEASEGTNTLPSAPYWVHFTATEDGYYIFSSANQTAVATYATIYDACGGEVLSDNVANGSQTEIELAAETGDEFYIYWDDLYSTSGFDWTISYTSFQTGEVCLSGAEAVEGTNTTPSAPYWFTYTLPQDGAVSISSVGTTSSDTYLYVYSDCDGTLLGSSDDYEDYQSQVILSTQPAGTTLYIYWDDEYSSSSFTWTLDVFDESPGQSCENPDEVSEGTNTVTIDNLQGNYYWATFTMTEDDKKLVVSSDADEAVYIVENCEGTILAYGDQTASYSELSAGEQVYIKWTITSGVSFDWELSVEEQVAGESCDNPAAAVFGTNTVPETSADYFYYSFTLSESGKKLVVSSSSGEAGGIIADCDFDILVEGYENFTATNLEAGVEYLLVWQIDNTSGGFDWTMSLEDLEEGDLCSTGLEATVGTNEAAQAPIWYTYTMPKDGNISISSSGLTSTDTYLMVYEDCDGTLLDESDDISLNNYQSTVSLTNVTAGTVLHIFWDGIYSIESFKWKITLSNVDNTAPVIAAQTFQVGTTELTDGMSIGTVVATDADGDALTFSITSSTSAFTIDATTGELILADASAWTSSSTSITVAVSDGVTSSSASMTIKAVILSADPDSALGIYPNPASETFKVQLSQNEALVAAYITDLSGKVIRKIDTSLEEHSISDLASGIYLVRLTLSDQSVRSEKLIVKK